MCGSFSSTQLGVNILKYFFCIILSSFNTGDASTNMTDEFEKAATALKGAVKVGAIDADQHRIIAKRFEVTEVPTVMIFSGEYSFPYFEERSARALAEVGLAEVYSKVKDQFKSVTSNDDLFKKNVNTTTENV